MTSTSAYLDGLRAVVNAVNRAGSLRAAQDALAMAFDAAGGSA